MKTIFSIAIKTFPGILLLCIALQAGAQTANNFYIQGDNNRMAAGREPPLQLQREKGDAVMRPGLIVNWEDGSFICSGTVSQGLQVCFSLPPDSAYINAVLFCSDPEAYAKGIQKAKRQPYFNHNGNYKVELSAIPWGTMVGVVSLLELFKQ